MSDEQQAVVDEVEDSAGVATTSQNNDSAADAGAILVIFTAAVMFCVFYISGWSFDL